MIEVALDSSSGIKVEVCQICEFVWFDTGETQPLQVRPPPEAAADTPAKSARSDRIGKSSATRRAGARLRFRQRATRRMVEIDRSVFRDAGGIRRAGKETPSGCNLVSGRGHRHRKRSLLFSFHEAVQLFGLIPAQATRMHGLTFVTSFFLHAGIIHLVGNMYFLLVFGDDVENFLRPLRYIALIAIAAFVGDLVHIASAPNSTIPCIGASGGIAGVITFYALAFPQAKIGFLWRYFYYFRWIRLPAWFVFVLWILFQIIGAYEQKIGISSVSSFAHLGGAAVG